MDVGGLVGAAVELHVSLPAKLTPATSTGPRTGSSKIPVEVIRPRHATVRGGPTLRETTRTTALRADGVGRVRQLRAAHPQLLLELAYDLDHHVL
jgi:hypothetical protein